MNPTRSRPRTPARTRALPRLAALLTLLGVFSPGALAQDAGDAPPVNPPMDWGDEPARRERPARAGNRGAPPGAEPAAAAEPPPEPTVNFGVFSEPVQLGTLIDFVGQTLGINIVVKGSPSGEIVFNAPVEVPRSQLLDLLDAMLEQYAFTIVSEPTTGFYIVQPITDVRPSVGGERASVRIIPTPNIKPSQLVDPLTRVLGTAEGSGTSVQAVDQLGVVIVTAPARDIARIESLIDELRRVDSLQRYIRLELDYIAAPAALERAVGLVGGAPRADPFATPQQNFQRGPRGEPIQQQAAGSGGSFSNLADRITVDPQGNALIFRGTDQEIERVRSVMAQIDVPNTLEPRSYYAGSSAAQIADMAQIRGLGEVIQVTEDQSQFGEFNQFQFFQNQNRFGQQTDDSASRGGPVMVVDPVRGNIIYYGTPEQHRQMADLMKELRTDDERVVIRNYVLNHSDAETVADLITGLITGQRQTGDAPLLPTTRGTNRVGTGLGRARPPSDPTAQSGDEVSASFDPDVVVVLPNIENNQVVVQAPIKQQDEIAKLIERLDRRRAQVYLQAMIVSVTDDENFLLAFESQYLRGDFGVGTNFGLSTAGTNFTDPKNVAPNLAGVTAAIIKSDYVPLIINASQTNTNTRILSMPQLLVNDNEESEIVSLSEEPYSEITNTDGNDPLQGFGGFAEAGTTLRVTPSISDGGFLRLDYYVELSNFTDATGTNGNPPPRDRNTVSGAVTIPSDATIVIGGITVDNVRNTIAKVPLLGDIPLVGELFKRRNEINNKARLYVFLTPRILTNPNFADLKLLTRGPQAEMDIDPDAPELHPEPIRATAPARGRAPELSPERLD